MKIKVHSSCEIEYFIIFYSTNPVDSSSPLTAKANSHYNILAVVQHVTYVTDFVEFVEEELYTLHGERPAANFNFQARAS